MSALLHALQKLRDACRAMDLPNEAERPSEDEYLAALAAADATIAAAAPVEGPAAATEPHRIPRLRRRDESLADYRVAMGWDPREKFALDKIEAIYHHYFSPEAGRTPRSEPYRLGFREALFSRLNEKRGLVCSDKPGTTAFDAYWVGVRDGNAVAGEAIASTAETEGGAA